MNYKKILRCIIAGDWHGVEVHDKEILRKYVMWACGSVLIIGLGTSVKSCATAPPVEYPPHIQVNG